MTAERNPEARPRARAFRSEAFPFVAIEGLDGSGKTQARRWIFEQLDRGGFEPIAITKNGWLDIGATRMITGARYLNEMPNDLDQLAAAYLADKLALCDRIVRPQRAVRPVVADRFLLSDLVYNDVQFGIDWRTTRDRYQASSGIECPSHTLFVHASPEVSAERLGRRPDGSVWTWERLDVQRRVATLFQDVLADAATRPLCGRLEWISNEGNLSAFEARIEDFVTRLVEELEAVCCRGSVA